MPVLFNDLSDDPLAHDRQRSFIGGQASYIRVNLITEDQCSSLVDVDIDTDLALENRRGFHKWHDLESVLAAGAMPQGIWFFDFAQTQFVLVAAGGRLFRSNLAGPWQLVSATALPSATAPAWGVQIGKFFWLADGTGRARFWTDAQLAAGHAGTPTTDLPAVIGTLAAVRYRLFGVDPAVPDEVYCSKFLPTDGTPFTLASAILPFRVGEGQGDPITAMVPWKGLFGMVVVRRNSLWVVDTTPAASEVSAATETSEFGIMQVGWLGSSAGRTVARSSNDVLYLAPDGIRSLARTVEDGEGKVSDPISQPIDDVIQRINTNRIHTSCATFHSGRYFCAVPLDAALDPSHVLVLNTRTGAWTVWTGLQPVMMSVAQWTAGPRQLLVLDRRGHVLEWRDYTPNPTPEDYRDNVTGVDVRPPWYVRTRAFTWGDMVCPKDPDFAEFEFDRSEALIDIDVRIDNEATGRRLGRKIRTGYQGWILAPEGGTPSRYPESTLDCLLGEQKVKRIRKSMTHYPDGREFMFEIREAKDLTPAELEESGVLRMRGILSGAFLETAEAQE